MAGHQIKNFHFLSFIKPATKKINNFRYERKFFIEDLSFREIEEIVKLNTYQFSEIYYPRYINNIYYDTHSMDCLRDNILGLSKRLKVRIRWYGDPVGHIKNPTLELKIKNGQLGKKRSLGLEDFKFNNQENFKKNLPKLIEYSNEIGFDLSTFQPTLINRYLRKYYLSKDKEYRITLDSNQTFMNLKNDDSANKIIDNTTLILELKYDHSKDRISREIGNLFPFRLSKSSKYVRGLSLFN